MKNTSKKKSKRKSGNGSPRKSVSKRVLKQLHTGAQVAGVEQRLKSLLDWQASANGVITELLVGFNALADLIMSRQYRILDDAMVDQLTADPELAIQAQDLLDLFPPRTLLSMQELNEARSKVIKQMKEQEATRKKLADEAARIKAEQKAEHDKSHVDKPPTSDVDKDATQPTVTHTCGECQGSLEQLTGDCPHCGLPVASVVAAPETSEPSTANVAAQGPVA